ncbi:alpha/beta fold hydrolase [Candidatus Bathyarchaeota archaeon]|nr:alpha/beta fold hydrolase [Candidatus Bathyarchaeota archaeon]
MASLQLKISADSSGITTEQVWLTTTDGTQLNAKIYKPNSQSGHVPGIVVCHGLAACHQMMQSFFSVEFAKRGFYVVAIDLRGHGDSGGGIEISFDVLFGRYPHVDDMSTYTFFNVAGVDVDVRAGVDYLLSRIEVDPNKIAILGHSLGGAAVFMEGYSDPRVKTVVAIAPVISPRNGMNLTSPPNLLLAVGGRDGIARIADVVGLLSKTTGGGEEVGKLYGNFSEGTARKMIVSDGVDHAGEMFDAFIAEESIIWVEASLSIESILPISISSWRSLFVPLFVITSLLSVFPAILVVKELGGIIRNGKPPEKTRPTRMSVKKLVFIYWGAWGCSVLVGMPLQIMGLFNWIPLVFADILLSAFVTASLIFLLALIVSRRSDEKLSLSMHKVTTNASLGVLGFLIVFITMNLVFTKNFLDLLPTTREFPLMIVSFFILLPLTFLEELWLRNLQLRFQKPWLKIGVPVLLYLSTKMLPLASVSFIFGNLVLLTSSLVFIPVLLTSLLFNENDSIIGGAVFNALLFAWLIAVVLPFGTYL